MPDVSITPDTKLFDVISAYPELGPVISDLIPSFAKLQTPALRETVAKTLTLEQAAMAADTSPVNVVMTLRKAAGIVDAPSPGKTISTAPAWVQSGNVVKELDARPLLAQGHHPKAEVIHELGALEMGQIFLLLTPFVPGPLVEIGRAQGLSTWTRQGEAGRFETYFGRTE